MAHQNTILIVDDDTISNTNLQTLLRCDFQDVYGVSNALEAWKMYRRHQLNILIVDIEMEGMNGLKLIEKIRETDKDAFIAIMTAFSCQHYLEKAVTLKLDAYITKPFTQAILNDLTDKIRSHHSIQIDHTIAIDKFTAYDSKAKIVMHRDNAIVLTNMEIILIELFLSSRSETFSYERIENALNRTDETSRNSIRILISRLRKKVPSLNIRSIAQVGYMLP